MSVIADLVERLQRVLEAEEDVYRRLKSVLRREERELIELDPIVLERTTAEKAALAAEAKLHEDARVELAAALGATLGLPGSTVRLSEIVSELGAEGGELPGLHARLTAIVGTTRSLLIANERFANRSLSHVKDTLRLLGQAVPDVSTYGPGMARTPSNGRGRLVRAAI